MAVDLKKILYFYDKAKKEYDDIMPLYNSVLEYTDQFAKLNANVTEEKNIKSRRNTLVAITDPLHSLDNFVMNALLTRGTKWATLEFEMEKEKDEEGNEEIPEESSEAEQELEKNIEKTFDYLEQSNYFTVIFRAIKDANALGTGCYRVFEQASTVRPFTFKYQPINNLYIYEDSFGKPNYIFNALGNVSNERLKDLYGSSAKVKTEAGTEEYSNETDVVECVYPEFNEETGITEYNYVVLGNGMQDVIFEEIRAYNPFVVFRSDKTSESPYGVGVGVKLLDAYEKLKRYIELREKHAEKLVDPPGGFIGDPKLFMKLRMGKGARNFLGSGQTGDMVDYKALYTGGSLLEISEDIATLKNEIKEVCMGSPLGSVGETTNRSATEMQMRFQLFREKFSGTYETYQEELLQKTFLLPFTILLKKNIISFPIFLQEGGKEGNSAGATVSDIMEVSNFKYKNKMSKQGDIEDVSNLNNYIGIVAEAKPMLAEYAVKDAEYIEYVGDKFDVPKFLRPSAKDLKGISNQIKQQQAQATQVQEQLDNADVVKTQNEAINTVQ